MANHVATRQPASVPALAMDEDELISVLQTSLYPGATIGSVKLVINYCKAAGLDPMQKPVHIVPMYDRKTKEMRDVILPGIGLYRTQAARSGEYAGVTEPEFGPDVSEKIGGASMTFPAWCRVTIRRLLGNGQMAEFSAIERWKENYATKGKDDPSPNAMWQRRPYAQLAKCAEAQALRKAFPEFGAQPTADEMEGKEFDMGPAEVVHEPAKAPPMPQRKSAPKIVEEAATINSAVEAEAHPVDDKPASDGMKKHLAMKAEQAGLTDAQLCEFVNVESLDQLTVSRVNALLKWIQNGAQ